MPSHGESQSSVLIVTYAQLAQGLALHTGRRCEVVVDARLTRARWSVERARCGDDVVLHVEAGSIPDGRKVVFDIYEQRADPPAPDHADPHADDAHVATIEAAVEGGAVEARWTYLYGDDEQDGPDGDERYAKPGFYFIAHLADLPRDVRARSGLLAFDDQVEVWISTCLGRPRRSWRFALVEASGHRHEGRVDAEGKATVEGVGPGPYRVMLVR